MTQKVVSTRVGEAWGGALISGSYVADLFSPAHVDVSNIAAVFVSVKMTKC